MEEFDSEYKSEVYLYCDMFFLDSGDLDYALELFENAADLAPLSESGKKAAAMLERYSE